MRRTANSPVEPGAELLPKSARSSAHVALPRLADRLAAAHHQRFWGREAELALFRSALDDDGTACSVFYVHGLGGVGKSALLRQYAAIAREAGVTTALLDARVIDASPGGFLLALRDALSLGAQASPSEYLRTLDRLVLLLDSYELLAPLEIWLRQTFLPELPSRAVVVMAGRNPPAPDWTSDPGWGAFLRTVPLRNLGPDASRSLLTERRVPDTQHEAILRFTHGHPLALVLVGDLVATSGEDVTFTPECAPNVVRVLLERFVSGVPSAWHRRALELCAHVRVTTEPLLGAIVEGADPHELFAWLRGLSFIEQGSEGLFPHDVARAALDADFRWRDPDAYGNLHRRIWQYLRGRLRDATGHAQQRAFFDKLYLHRGNPVGARHHDYGTLGSVYVEPAVEGDHELIVDTVSRHEGDQSASIARHWVQSQPGAFFVIRGADSGLLGFVATLIVPDTPSPADLRIDPALRAAWEFARRHGPLRSGEVMLHHRFHMARDVYQALSPTINLLATMVTIAPMHQARLAWSFITFAASDPWRSIMEYISFEPANEAGFVVGDRRYAVFAHDWRVESFDAWWEREAERSLGTESAASLRLAEETVCPVVLSEPEFTDEVRKALRDYRRTAALSKSPLLRSRVVLEATGTEPAVSTLQRLLREAVECLKAHERDEKFHRALLHTYIQPAPPQERVAERLGLPFSTYRYHLARGVERVAGSLWQRELHGHIDLS